MSWYFFGGFSAYAIDPSARLENHSGWSVTQGWSGEACRAKSIATSRPSDLALATNRSKASKSPRSGWMASWPPSRRRWPTASPGSDGPGFRVLFGPLRKAPADRMDRRQVDHVEAHRGGGLQPLVRGVEGAGLPGVGLLVVLGTLRAGEELVPGGEQRGPPVDVDRVLRGGGDELARTVPEHRGADVVGEHDLQPVLDLLGRVQALGRAAQQRGDLGGAGRLGALGRGA